MARTIVISDIHGYYELFMKLLEQVQYDPACDQLYLLGDYVDGGPESLAVIRTVMQLTDDHNHVQAIGGNHDDMLLHWLDDNDYPRMPYTSLKNGGSATIRSLCPWYQSVADDSRAREFINEHYPDEISFLRRLPYYIEDEKHIYVHAGIDPEIADWRQTSPKDFRWIRGRFYQTDGSAAVTKKVIFGHEVCARLHQDETNFDPWFGKQFTGIDGGVKFGYQLNALIIYENGGYQTSSIQRRDRE
ncbi:metallophosphoesterase [Paenibacillus sp. FSL R7-0345]|uniref:metallophosphoesterase n=1 Tax=Paenibacillus sp. FSL R7-0345 TaxID=2954535 RepID=UPI00315A7FE8